MTWGVLLVLFVGARAKPVINSIEGAGNVE